ncbi:sigma-70 family RNA polymerase sigma factor [Singulisphaera sp. PoT]|uniref:sigma-70 family RNA polymerase sigma factor n=1 Tax=Singulisphaera sp. PoT TaxID=3411797 RepID=UPI003BF4E841
MGNRSELEPETWVERHGDSLYRFAILRVGDPEVAADLVQEAFLEALRTRDAFGGRSSVRTWLIAILKHKILDHHRRSGRERRRESREPPEGGATASGPFDRRGSWRPAPSAWKSDPLREYERLEFWEVLGGCIAEMPPHLADVFLDLEVEGASRESICDDMNISMENLSVRLYRARLLLRRCLEIRWFQGRTEGRGSPAPLAWSAPPQHAPERI